MQGFPWGSDGKESACNAGDPNSILESETSLGEGNGYPIPYMGTLKRNDRYELIYKTETDKKLEKALMVTGRGGYLGSSESTGSHCCI